MKLVSWIVIPVCVALGACAEEGPGSGGAREDEAQSCHGTAALENATRPAAVSFRKDVAPIFAASCSFSSCHGVKGRGLYFAKDASEMRAALVDKPSSARSTVRLVVANAPQDSWLLSKLTGQLCDPSCANGACGVQMPKGGDPLPDADIAKIEKWIGDGAKDD